MLELRARLEPAISAITDAMKVNPELVNLTPPP